MQLAEYEMIEDEEYRHIGTIPGLQGLWAGAPTLEACRVELEETLEDWILVGIRLGHTFPSIDGIDLNVPGEPLETY